MKSITIHKLDDRTARLIELKSKETGLSLNNTIKNLLRKALGIQSETNRDKSDFQEFSGIWNESDFKMFQESTAAFGEIDDKDWK